MLMLLHLPLTLYLPRPPYNPRVETPSLLVVNLTNPRAHDNIPTLSWTPHVENRGGLTTQTLLPNQADLVIRKLSRSIPLNALHTKIFLLPLMGLIPMRNFLKMIQILRKIPILFITR